MRVFISADIEGVAGVTALPTTGPWRHEWAQGRRWMTEEVLAAIAGARAAGATSFVVSDGHGSAHNLLPDLFTDDTELVRAWPRPLLQMDGIDRGPFDACIFIGHHAMAQAWRGVLAHSFTMTFREIRLCDVPQSETSINAHVAAHFGVPVVFASGDDDYVAHTRSFLPDIETVTTQRALSYTAVACLTPAESCRRIRAGVERAMARRAGIRGIAPPARYRLDIDFASRSQPEMLDYLPWLERSGPYTISVEVADAAEMLRLIAFLAFYQAEGVPRYGERRL
jgi:D-amino peptidase